MKVVKRMPMRKAEGMFQSIRMAVAKRGEASGHQALTWQTGG
jgi:hypothetical protein